MPEFNGAIPGTAETTPARKPRKLTLKQERFAREYVANGGNATSAYRTVYDVGDDTLPATVNRSAYVIAGHPNVAARIDQIADEWLAGAQIGPEYVAQRLKGMIDTEDYNPNARVKAVGLLMKLLGLDVTTTRHEGTIHHDIDPAKAALSIEDLEALAADARQRLALEGDGGTKE